MKWMIAGIVLVSCLGCGGSSEPNYERASITGTVTYGGEPVPAGLIRFVPETGVEGEMVFAKIQDGKYQIAAEKGPSVGKHRVEITADRKTGEKVQIPDAAPGTMEEVTEQYIPAQYNLSSKLTVDIAPGENKKDFPLDKRS